MAGGVAVFVPAFGCGFYIGDEEGSRFVIDALKK